MSRSPRSRWKVWLAAHRKDPRLVVGSLAALLVLFSGGYYLMQRGRDLPSALVTNKVLLFSLWYVNVVLILAVSFVLLRNLFKLLLERRARILGSNFKFKLVATYVGMSLIPVLLLFAIATELLQGSVERWFNTPLKPILAEGSAVAQELYGRIERTDLHAANHALTELAGFDLDRTEERTRLSRRVGELQSELGLDFLAVYQGNEFLRAAIDPQAGFSGYPEPGRDFLAEVVREGQALRRQERQPGQGRLLLAGMALQRPAPLVVIAGSLLPAALADASESLIESHQGLRQLEVQKDDLRASHLLIFLMVTLLILLASSWTGLYLARQVTLPIQALAEGTRRISGGDLAHRVDVVADDELGVLVSSFNRMTEELQSNKELLEYGYRELTASNERLAEERALLAAVLENVAAGVVATGVDERIFLCNGAALAILRQDEGEVLGQSAAVAWADPERRKVAALLSGEPATGSPDPQPGDLTREVHLILGGDWKTFEVTVTPMRDSAGALRGRVLVIEDLTELLKAQQLATWNEAARRIAHEIKNPLTPIRLGAERLLHKSRQGDPDLGRAIEDAVEIIVREVGTIQEMVDEFSRFARMPRPRPAVVDIPRLLAEALHLYRNLKPGVEVSGGVTGELPEVRLDGEQIKRALINLLDNAIEATEPPGWVTVSAHAAAGGEAGSARLEIEVADTGPGIPPESKEKLFLPYFSTKGRGTGLGLAIVHRIAADHHGVVRVEDNSPHGTVFILDLPLA